MCAANLAGPVGDAGLAGGRPVTCLAGESAADGDEWVYVPLRYAAVKAARPLLSFGDDVVVLSPAEVRDELAAAAAAVVASYAGAR
jgi:predicted DNA-binding transcriptional regulator YafY